MKAWGLAIVVSAIANAQPLMPTPQSGSHPPLTFEVASVKPGDGQGGVTGGCHGIDSKYGTTGVPPMLPLGRCVIANGRLSHLIYIAFNLDAVASIKNAPDWVMGGYDRYTVEAKAEDPSKYTDVQLQEMLQSLLVERFKLKYHWDAVEQPGFRLVVAKGGPKLKPTAGDQSVAEFDGVRKCCAPGVPVNMTVKGYSMKVLANLLSNIGPAPIVDQTGLTGEYDFRLSWDDTNGPELKAALQDQLGLRLEPQKVSVPQFVVDSAEKPTQN